MKVVSKGGRGEARVGGEGPEEESDGRDEGAVMKGYKERWFEGEHNGRSGSEEEVRCK